MLLNLRDWGGKRLENRREIWLSHVACHCTVLYPFFSQISRHFYLIYNQDFSLEGSERQSYNMEKGFFESINPQFLGPLTSSFFFKLHWNNNIFGMSVVPYFHLFLLLFSLYKLHQSSHHAPPLAHLYHITPTLWTSPCPNITFLQTCHFYLNMLLRLTTQEYLPNGIKHLLPLSHWSACNQIPWRSLQLQHMANEAWDRILMAISWLSFFF